MVSVLPQITKLRGAVVSFLFPERCVGCGKEGDFICRLCQQSLLQITLPDCPRCGSPQAEGKLCPDCTGRQVKFDGIRSPFRFDGAIRQAIHELKYRNLRAIARPLAELLQQYLITNPIPAEILVPVPLHRKRLRERGYNQSDLLAQELSQLTNLPTIGDCLIRQRYALPQARTSNVEERKSNIDGAFTCLDGRLRDKRVLLIDDVATSGATLDACAEAIKAAGASSVWGLVMAREI